MPAEPIHAKTLFCELAVTNKFIAIVFFDIMVKSASKTMPLTTRSPISNIREFTTSPFERLRQ